MARLPYRLARRKAKDGTVKVYCYHRVTGRPLPPPGSPGFETALKAAAIPITNRENRKTLWGLIEAFALDVGYQRLARASKLMYERTFAMLNATYGTRPVESITRDDIEILHRQVAHSPSLANQFISNCNTLFNYAELKGVIAAWQKPNLKRMKLETGEYATWEPEDIERFLASDLKPKVRLTFLLGFYTGQRVSDVLAMEWKHHKRGIIAVSQMKTGARVWVPCHPNLEMILTDLRRRNPASPLIVDWGSDDPLTRYKTFHHQFQVAKRKAKLTGRDYPFHGLRKTAACMLYEAGCDVAEIKAITGHTSLAMVEHYIREAKAQALADSAMKKILAQQENRFSNVHRMIAVV